MDLHDKALTEQDIFEIKRKNLEHILNEAARRMQRSVDLDNIQINLNQTIDLLREERLAIDSVSDFLSMQENIINSPSFKVR